MNFLQYRVTWQGIGRYGVGGNSYAEGDTFVLPEDQARRFVKSADLLNGNLEFMGEVSGDDTTYFSANASAVLDGRPGMGKNVMPMSVIDLAAPIAAGAGNALGTTSTGTNLSSGIVLGRRAVIDKILVKNTTHSGGADEPRILATVGAAQRNDPTSLRYLDGGVTYGAMINGAIDAAAPIAWALNDLMIIGYSAKFRSVSTTVDTAAATANGVSAASYWNGSAWVAFDTFTDLTQAAGAANSFDVVTSEARLVWWDAPDDWEMGGPTGSGCLATSYYVALTVSGALTTLDGLNLYPCTDIPVADINLGEQVNALDAVLSEIGGTWLDETADAASTTADDVSLDLDAADYLFIGYSKPYAGAYVNVGGTPNNAAETMVVNYWNGTEWSPNATEAADAWAGVLNDATGTTKTFAVDGVITTALHPADWVAAVWSDVDLISASALTAITSTPLYWLRISASGALLAGGVATQLWALPAIGAYVEYNCTPGSRVEATDPINLIKIHGNDTVATDTIKAVIADI